MWPLTLRKIKQWCALGHAVGEQRNQSPDWPPLPCATSGLTQCWALVHGGTGGDWSLSHRALELAARSTEPQRFQGGLAPDSPPYPEPAPGSGFSSWPPSCLPEPSYAPPGSFMAQDSQELGRQAEAFRQGGIPGPSLLRNVSLESQREPQALTA